MLKSDVTSCTTCRCIHICAVDLEDTVVCSNRLVTNDSAKVLYFTNQQLDCLQYQLSHFSVVLFVAYSGYCKQRTNTKRSTQIHTDTIDLRLWIDLLPISYWYGLIFKNPVANIASDVNTTVFYKSTHCLLTSPFNIARDVIDVTMWRLVTNLWLVWSQFHKSFKKHWSLIAQRESGRLLTVRSMVRSHLRESRLQPNS